MNNIWGFTISNARAINYDKNDLVASVSKGKAAMSLGWPSWFISGSDSLANYAVIPGKKDASSPEYSAGVIGNWMMGVTANTTHKDLAVKLLQYITSAEVQISAADKGAVPTRTSVFNNADMKLFKLLRINRGRTIIHR